MSSERSSSKSDSAERSNPLALAQGRIDELIADGDLAAAKAMLKKAAAIVASDPEATAWCHEAAARIKTLDKAGEKARAEASDNNRRLFDTARQLFDASDYEQAHSLLASIPPAQRSQKVDALVVEIEEIVEELQQLEADLVDAVQHEALDDIRPIIDRLLELRPWHRLALRIQRNLGKIRRGKLLLTIGQSGHVELHNDQSFQLGANVWGLVAMAIVGLILVPTLWNYSSRLRPLLNKPAAQESDVATNAGSSTPAPDSTPPGVPAQPGANPIGPAPVLTPPGLQLGPQPDGFEGLRGLLFAPVQGTELVVTRDSATLKVAAAVHDLSIELGQMTAPRALEPVSGDFDYQVQVSNVNGPQGPSLQAKRVAFVGAGILVWRDKQNYIRLERAALGQGGSPQVYANWEQRVSGAATRMGSSNDHRLTSNETWLRVRRRGDRIEGAVSEDGATWFDLPALRVDWPQDVQIGIAAVNNTPVGYDANFKERVLTVR